MQWSQLKKQVEDRFAASLCGRVRVHLTRYSCSCGRGWITVDGEMAAAFDYHQVLARFGEWHFQPGTVPSLSESCRIPGHHVEKGEFNTLDFLVACTDMLNESFEGCLSSPSPVLRAFAMLDQRLGKRRFEKISDEEMHPLSAYFGELRRKAEGWPTRAQPAPANAAAGVPGTS